MINPEMTDIVERLRERSQNLWTTDAELRSNQLFKDAAAEIERLRAALRAILAVPADWGNESYEMEELARAALAQEKQG